jgi:hypothetical protein
LLHWKKVVLVTIVGGIFGVVFGYSAFVRSTPMWEGTSLLVVAPFTGDAVWGVPEQIRVTQESPAIIVDIMRSREFIVAATSRAGRPDLAKLLIDRNEGGDGRLQVKMVRNSPALMVSVRAPSQDNARAAVTAVSSEIIRRLRGVNQPVLDYAKQFLDESEALIEKDRRNFDAIEEQLEKLRQSKNLDEGKYLTLLSLQSQSAISRSQLLNRVVGVKADYLSASAKLPREISGPVVSAQAVSPRGGVLVLGGMICGALIALGVSLLVVAVRNKTTA